jgi:hypothetical protein
MSPVTEQPVVLTKKSGKGRRHGVVSEVSAYFHVRPGHTEELRAAIDRFQQKLHNAPPQLIQRFGLQDMRHVIFDNGTRLNWATSFETDWEPYIDDSVAGFGLKTWYDWFQHCEECPENFLNLSAQGLRDFIQSGQVQAAGFFKSISDKTLPEVRKAERVQKALEQVIDDPEAIKLLQQPPLKPLLDEAAD